MKPHVLVHFLYQLDGCSTLRDGTPPARLCFRTVSWRRNTCPECRQLDWMKRENPESFFCLLWTPWDPAPVPSCTTDGTPTLEVTVSSSFVSCLCQLFGLSDWQKYHSVQEMWQRVFDTWSILTHIVQIEISTDSIQTLNLLQKVKKIFLRLFFGGRGVVETWLRYVSLAGLKLTV